MGRARLLGMIAAGLMLAACDTSPSPRAESVVDPSPLGSSVLAESVDASGLSPSDASARAPEVDRGVDGADCPAPFACKLGEASPRVDEILVRKAAHRLYLVEGDAVVRTYQVALGWGGLGQKLYEGDGTTPIGTYAVIGRYPSKWHTYLALDYPRPEDDARYARAVADGSAPSGRTAGSAIAIHGHRDDQQEKRHKLADWTLGCVALDNGEIDEIASLTGVGTKVVIEP